MHQAGEARIRLVALALCFCAATDVSAQARRLEPADFVVAGIPENYPDLDVETDTARIRQAWGRPIAIHLNETKPGDTLTTWEYDGVMVTFGYISRLGITLTSPRIATQRGLRVGDCEQRVRALYGLPSWREDLDWIYEDPRERLNVIRVTVRNGRVKEIYIGSLWD